MRLLPAVVVVLLLVSACQMADQPQQITHDEVLATLEAAADRGDRDAAISLELLRYRNGDNEGGRQRLQGYALLGHTRAAHAVADIYMNGWGVEVDYDEAARWLAVAADDGDARALHMLAAFEDHRRAESSSGV